MRHYISSDSRNFCRNGARFDVFIFSKEFGCVFEKGELLIWVETNDERAEQIFDSLRKRNCAFSSHWILVME
jgi:hypothetical protein